MNTPLRRALQTLAVGALLLGLLMTAGEGLLRKMLPAQHWLFEQLMPEFKVLAFGLDHELADRVLRVEVTRQRYVLLGGQVIEPNQRGTAQASTLALQTLFGPLLALWVALAWPAARPLNTRLRRLAWLLPPAALLAWVDTPVVLAAQLWTLMVEHYAPGEFSPLIIASSVLQGGGRQALGLAIGAAALAATLPRRPTVVAQPLR